MNNKGNSLLYVGMDVHKESVVFAVFRGYEQKPFIQVSKKNDSYILKKYFNKLKEKGTLICCYEAGPCGFHMYRLLENLNISCIVAAPGLIPCKPGERIKTDARDAEALARNLRAGVLPSVHVPTKSDEAVRDYLRMRDDLIVEIKRYKQRTLSFVDRYGYRYKPGTNRWTIAHRSWLKELTGLEPLQRETLDEYMLHLNYLEEKQIRIDKRIEEIAEEDRYRDMTKQFTCLKGIGILTALSLVVEIGDFKRFSSAAKFMGYLGLVPSKHSSGMKRNQGGLTKSGNSRLRKLLIESSWHYSFPYQPSKRVRRRREGQRPQLIKYADKAGRRLSSKFSHLIFRGKPSQRAAAAVARELAGLIWGIAHEKYV